MRDAEKKTTAELLAAEFFGLHGGDEALMLVWFKRAMKAGRIVIQESISDAVGRLQIKHDIIHEVDGRRFGQITFGKSPPGTFFPRPPTRI